jgi:hypothetical protein
LFAVEVQGWAVKWPRPSFQRRRTRRPFRGSKS